MRVLGAPVIALVIVAVAAFAAGTLFGLFVAAILTAASRDDERAGRR